MLTNILRLLFATLDHQGDMKERLAAYNLSIQGHGDVENFKFKEKNTERSTPYDDQ